mgnify:CR=1 FL=1
MAENATKSTPAANKATASVAKNEVADLKNRLEQLRLENLKNLEFVKDVKAIVKLFIEFKAKVGFPDKVNFTWVLMNYKAIINLLKDTIYILKTKSVELAS